jgi:uncharacterized membrane protein
LAGVLLLALALRVWDLGARSLWFDEANEYWVATAPFVQIMHSVGVGILDPPLYSFLLHLWMKFSANEWWLRFLSVIASLAGVMGVMVLARRLGGTSTAIAAGLLAAVSPSDIRYAQEVGQYALMLGTLSWNLVALHGLWSEGGRTWVLAWASTALLVSTSFYAAVLTVGVPFCCALIEALVRRDVPRVRRFAAALGLYLILVVPALWNVLPDQFSRVLNTRAMISDDPQQRPEGIALGWRWLCDLFAFHFTGWSSTRVPAWIPIACWFALFAFALRGRPRWALWFVATVAVYTAAALLNVLPFGFRWGLILLPSTIVLAASGVTSGDSTRLLRFATASAFAALVVGGVVSLPNRTVRDATGGDKLLLWPETEDLRPVVEYWHDRWSHTQPTYVYYGAAPAFAYYLQRYPNTRVTLPSTWLSSCWQDEIPPPFCSNDNIYYGPWLRSRTRDDILRSLAKTLTTRPGELWVVFSHVRGQESADIIDILKQNGYAVEDWVQERAAGAVLLRRE